MNRYCKNCERVFRVRRGTRQLYCGLGCAALANARRSRERYSRLRKERQEEEENDR